MDTIGEPDVARNSDVCTTTNDPGRTRACNPRLRRLMPYPLGHGASDFKDGKLILTLQERSGVMQHYAGRGCKSAARSFLEVVQRAFGCNARTKRDARIVFYLFISSNRLTVILEDIQ